MSGSSGAFLVARNPDADSKLPYLLQLPLDDGIVLKARESWPGDRARLLPPLRAGLASGG